MSEAAPARRGSMALAGLSPFCPDLAAPRDCQDPIKCQGEGLKHMESPDLGSCPPRGAW